MIIQMNDASHKRKYILSYHGHCRARVCAPALITELLTCPKLWMSKRPDRRMHFIVRP